MKRQIIIILAALIPVVSHAQALPTAAVSVGNVVPISTGIDVVHGYRTVAANQPYYSNAVTNIGRGTAGALARVRAFTPQGLAVTAAMIAAGYVVDELSQSFTTEPVQPPMPNPGDSIYKNNGVTSLVYATDPATACANFNQTISGSWSYSCISASGTTLNIRRTDIGAGWGDGDVFAVPGTYVSYTTGMSPFYLPPPEGEAVTDEQIYDALLQQWSPYQFRSLFVDPLTGRAIHVAPEMDATVVQVGDRVATQLDADPLNDPLPEDWATTEPQIDPTQAADDYARDDTVAQIRDELKRQDLVVEQPQPTYAVPAAPEANWSISTALSDFFDWVKSLFPFSLLISPLAAISGDTTSPTANITGPLGQSLTIDLSPWDDLFAAVRAGEGLVMIFGFYLLMVSWARRL